MKKTFDTICYTLGWYVLYYAFAGIAVAVVGSLIALYTHHGFVIAYCLGVLYVIWEVYNDTQTDISVRDAMKASILITSYVSFGMSITYTDVWYL